MVPSNEVMESLRRDEGCFNPKRLSNWVSGFLNAYRKGTRTKPAILAPR